MTYKLLPHTADMGIKAQGKDFSSALQNTILGMLSIIYDLKNVSPVSNINLKISADDLQSLVVKSLNEVLNVISIKKFLPKKIKCRGAIYCTKKNKVKSEKIFLKIKLTGEKINLKKHNMFKEIKSATYHKLGIYKRNSVTYIKIYFDV